MVKSRRIGWLTLLALVLAVVVVADPSLAEYAEKSNQYIHVKMGIHDTPTIRPVPGRFSVGAVEGDPDTLDDNGQALLFGYDLTPEPVGYFGYGVLRIADANWEGIWGDEQRGSWALEPIAGHDEQTAQYVRGEWSAGSSNILVKMKIDLRRDMGRIETTIINQDSATHQVGFRLHFDEVAFANCNTKPVVPGFGLLTAEREFLGANVPDHIDHFDSLSTPKLVSRHILRGSDSKDPTPPDRVAIGNWRWMVPDNSRWWPYTVVPDRTFTETASDTATSLWWNPIPLLPNEQRVLVTYFGMGSATSDFHYPAVLSLQAARALKYDSTTTSGLAPDPFVISAYLYNLYNNVDLSNAACSLSLPTGLELAPGETATKALGSIDPETEAKATWQVVPTGDVAGDLAYFVTAAGGGLTTKTVQRSVVVPSTPRTNLVTSWQMISVPFSLADPTPEAALPEISGSVRSLSRFNPVSGAYEPVMALQLGEAYWLNLNSAFTPATLAGASPLTGDTTFQIPVRAGWNQIGNPYVYDITWGQVRVLNERSGLGPITIEDAARRNWIKTTIWWWNTAARAYDKSSSRTTRLKPWTGYWIKSLVPCKLVVPQIDQLESGIITP